MRERVPVRTIVTAIGLLVLTALAVLLVMRLERVLIWGVVAAFFAVALAPVVGFAQRRLRLRRSLATLLVFLLGFILLAAIVALLVTPLVTRAPTSLTGCRATSMTRRTGAARSATCCAASTCTSTSPSTRTR